MALYRIEYRRGHQGVASRDDYVEELEADSPHDVIPEIARDWPRTQHNDILICTAPDESGRWEHNVVIEPIE